MKLIDMYFDYKNTYEKYLILVSVGTFIEVYGKDTIILNSLFGYKVTDYHISKRCGFPSSALKKVEEKLAQNKINYIVLSKNNIIEKKRFIPNNYDNYKNANNIAKLNKIIEKLKRKSTSYDFEELLIRIENLL